MTEATKFTPDRWALVVFSSVRVKRSYSQDSVLLYEGIRKEKEKGTGKQGARRHVTGSETACLLIRTGARIN